MSLTGPVMAPATPAAPEAAAPMIRPPMMMADQGGGYEAPQRTDAAFQNLQPIGNRSGAEIRGDLGRIGGFFMSPLATMASYAMTGKSPMELMTQGAQSPFGGFLQGLQDSFARNVFGPEEVPLFETRAPMQTAVPSMVFDGGLYSVTPELSPIEQTNALFNDPAFYNAIVAGVPVDQMQQTNMAPILEALNQSILQGTSTMEQFGPQETGGGFAPSDSGFTGGGWSAGDVAGAYSDSTGFE